MSPDIKIVGVGGQGVITAGMILSEAYRNEKQNVVMSEIHGLSQRGGSVSVDVRTGDVRSPIPLCSELDLLLAFEPLEGARFRKCLSNGASLIVSDEKLPPVWLGIRRKEYPDIKSLFGTDAERLNIYLINAKELAEQAGGYRMINSVMLGAAFSLGTLELSLDSLKKALTDVLGDRNVDANLRAFQKGAESVASRSHNYMEQPQSTD